MEENSECTDVSLNPFEAESTDSLHLSKFSPSIFKIKSTPSSVTKKPTKFRWSIDQLAILHPADIDETPQQDAQVDHDTEQRIQQAIDEFFSQKQVAPSPWSAGGKPLKHVTFSPHPPSTNYYDVKSADNSGASSCDTSFTSNKPTMADACSQTCLTLPLDFDLHALLQSFYSFQQGNMNEILSTSSLRRKLFLPSERTTESDSSPSMNYIQSSRCESSVFPEASLSLSPINSIKQSIVLPDQGTPNTPASAKSQFSSSPKSTPSFTPIGKKHASLSSDIESPPVSPIKMDSLENPLDNHRVRMHPIENTPCGRTKSMFYLAAPEISPIHGLIGCNQYSPMKLESNCKGKENKYGAKRGLSNSNIAHSVSKSNTPRGAVAKLNLMTVLDSQARYPTKANFKSADSQHPVKGACAKELPPKHHLPNVDDILDNYTQDLLRSKQLQKSRDTLCHDNIGEMQLTPVRSCDTSVMDANQRKLPQIDASMLDYSLTDTFDVDTNTTDGYLTSTMRKDYFSEVPSEIESVDFPISGYTDNNVGCALISKIIPNEVSCCQENLMDISQESLSQPENQYQSESLFSKSNKIESLQPITTQNQLDPVDPPLLDMTNGVILLEDCCNIGSGRCDLEMSTMDSNCNIEEQVNADKQRNINGHMFTN